MKKNLLVTTAFLFSILLSENTSAQMAPGSDGHEQYDSAGLQVDPGYSFRQTASGLPKFTNYPNPTKGSTTIKYNISVKGHVSVILYNFSGQVVSVIFDGYKGPGNYQADYNTANIPEGMYVCRMSFPSEKGPLSSATMLTVSK